MNETDKRFGLVRIDFEVLASVLKLPSGVSVRNVVFNPQYDGLTLMLQGEGLPETCRCRSGAWEVPYVEPLYRSVTDTHAEFSGWAG